MTMNEDVARLTGHAVGPARSMAAFAGVLAGLTLIAVAAGAALGLRLAATARAEPPRITEAAPSRYAGETALRDLAPIIANLADPPSAWVRLQATLVFSKAATPNQDAVAAQISEDILGFMRTITLAQIAGPSGLQHLREDLNDRAAIRSEGSVRELILQTLVVQ